MTVWGGKKNCARLETLKTKQLWSLNLQLFIAAAARQESIEPVLVFRQPD